MANPPNDNRPADTAPAPAAAPDLTDEPLPTGQPGAHAVGASLGAVGAGAAGAALGAVGGPIGVVVGAIVGAVAGAIIGKETAETVNPTEPAAAAPLDPAAPRNAPPVLTGVGTPDTLAFLASGSPDPLLQSMASSAIAAGLGTLHEPSPPSSHAEGHVHAGPAHRDEPPPPTPTPPMMSALTTAAATAATASHPSGRLQRISAATPPLPPVDLIVQESYPEGNVRDAAYFRYIHRLEHGVPGDELTDWTEAEREVLRG